VIEDAVDSALYDDDPVVRDRARQKIAQQANSPTIIALIQCLDAPQRLTRRRAAAILSDIPPSRGRPELVAALRNRDLPVRSRVAVARILVSQADGIEPALEEGFMDPEPRVRRACTTPLTPRPCLMRALMDADREVVARSAQALLILEVQVELSILRGAVQKLEEVPAPLIRLLARWSTETSALSGFAEVGVEAALDHLRDREELRGLMASEPVTAAWGLSRIGDAESKSVSDADPRIRSAWARSAVLSNEELNTLKDDTDAAVRWYARRALSGDYSVEVLSQRLQPHTQSSSPSARPPYGLRPDDVLPVVERVHAAVGLCQARFDINLGVAMRSAEAAGLEAVYFVGRGDYVRSPSRGADLAIPVHHREDAAALIRTARHEGYQIVAIQQTAGSVPYHLADYPPNPLFVVGAEDVGMPGDLREAADLNVEIPQFGIIDSLNVATALTVVLFHWRVHRES